MYHIIKDTFTSRWILFQNSNSSNAAYTSTTTNSIYWCPDKKVETFYSTTGYSWHLKNLVELNNCWYYGNSPYVYIYSSLLDNKPVTSYYLPSEIRSFYKFGYLRLAKLFYILTDTNVYLSKDLINWHSKNLPPECYPSTLNNGNSISSWINIEYMYNIKHIVFCGADFCGRLNISELID